MSTRMQVTEEFCRLTEHLNAVLVCTSLSDADATARVNLVPPLLPGGWRLTSLPDAQPRTCPDDPGMHRHMVFICGPEPVVEAVAR